jgi:FeS assembly SUF system protein
MSQFQQLGTARLRPDGEIEAAPPPPAAAPAPQPATPSPEPLTTEQMDDLRQRIVAVLCTCFDPEVPVNIYELGLIYGLDIQPSGAVTIRMTLTTPACPVAGSLPGDVQRKVQAVAGVSGVQVELVWDPPWDKNRVSDAAKLQLGIDDW